MSPAVFRWTSWLPLASLAATMLYVGDFEGWGRWAAAPLLLLPVALSALMTALGVGACRQASQAGGRFGATLLATLAAAVPLLWFLARALFA